MIHNYRLPKLQLRRFGFTLMLPVALCGAVVFPTQLQTAIAQTSDNRPLSIRADVQEYNSNTQVVTARGNVQLSYPARQIKATAAQAQFFNRERRIILSGGVYILQNGTNSIRGETVTYLIDEGRFVATPKTGRQVESIYVVDDAPNTSSNQAPSTPRLRRSN
ncbi:MAG: LptA/OstA family protein [Cyanobacteria bacterium P01_H01_bin.150]